MSYRDDLRNIEDVVDGAPDTPEGCPTSYCILDRGHVGTCAQSMREVALLAERDELNAALDKHSAEYFTLTAERDELRRSADASHLAASTECARANRAQAERDELREALQGMLDVQFMATPEEAVEAGRRAEAALSRHPSQPVKGTP